MLVPMSYGSSTLTFQAPDDSRAEVVRPRNLPVQPDADAYLSCAVGPRLEPALRDCAGRDVLLLLPDGTRDQPIRAGLAALAPLLSEARSVHVLLATGTHRADTPDDSRILNEVRQVCGDRRIPLASAGAHDCRSAQFFKAGVTPSGNEIRLNALLERCDAALVVSDMKPHYFAGYSNATKFLMPGIAAFDCIERNHACALDPDAAACRHPLHADPARRRNPVADDQLEAARLVTARTPVHALVTVGRGADVSWATFGPLESAVSEGIAFVDEHLVATVGAPARRLVISCGGYPNDETLYIAQRALELTREAVADGAEILWLAECRNGIASSEQAVRSFFTPLRTDPAAYIREIRRKYVLFSHKTVRFVELLDRIAALHLVTALPADLFPIRSMVKCRDPAAVAARWAAEGERVLFIDEANRLAVRCGTRERS